MKDNSFILMLLCAMGSVMVFAGQFGIGLTGAIEPTIKEQGSAPGLTGVISYCWNGMGFFFQMMFFQLPGFPLWASGFIDLVIGVFLGWIILKWVRGSSSGV